MNDFEFVRRHDVRHTPDYWFEVDEYKRPDGAQFLLAHLGVTRFSRAVLRDMHWSMALFRAAVPLPLFAVGEVDDAKFERFVARFGFKPLQQVICNNGVPRRLFVSFPQDNHERLQKDNH